VAVLAPLSHILQRPGIRFRERMTKAKPKTRTGAAAPVATDHLQENQKKALDLLADAEHDTGTKREKKTRQIQRLGNSGKKTG
jgi:hypothetical protein